MTTAAPAPQDDVVRGEIVRMALRLYQKFGPEKVTMDDVANAIGRSRTSLYYYFKNRDEILQAVLDTIVNDVAAEIRSTVTEAAALDDKIYAFCLAKLKTSEDWKRVFGASWLSMNADEQSKHAREKDVLHKKLIYQERIILNEILSAAAGQKEIRLISPGEQDLLIFIISSGIRGFRREIYEHNDPHDAKAATQLLTDMIMKWLKE